MRTSKVDFDHYYLLGLEAEKSRIETLIAEVKSGGKVTEIATPKPETKPRRKMSAAARKRIGDATKKRWAALRKSKAKEA